MKIKNTSPSLKEKQAATKKHFAKEFPLITAEGLVPAWVPGEVNDKGEIKAKPRGRQGGRKKGSKNLLRIWVDDSFSAAISKLAEQSNSTPGEVVETLYSFYMISMPEKMWPHSK